MKMHDQGTIKQHYGRLLLMTVLSFAAMYILMYAMVDRVANLHPSINQAYMAGLMTAPMVLIELLTMGMMYQNKRWNAAILTLTAIVGVACFAGIRQQTFIGDRDFARSMIPHHAARSDVPQRLPQRPEVARALSLYHRWPAGGNRADDGDPERCAAPLKFTRPDQFIV